MGFYWNYQRKEFNWEAQGRDRNMARVLSEQGGRGAGWRKGHLD